MSQTTVPARLEPTPDNDPPREGAIACVAWPREGDRRTELAAAGVPRLLFVEPGHTPPELWDLDEDWVRVPASVDEVALRAATLRRRLVT